MQRWLTGGSQYVCNRKNDERNRYKVYTSRLFIMLVLVSTKKLVQDVGLGLESGIDFLLGRLLDKFLVFYESGLFQSHRLGILEERKSFSVLVQNQNTSIKWTKACGLQPQNKVRTNHCINNGINAATTTMKK